MVSALRLKHLGAGGRVAAMSGESSEAEYVPPRAVRAQAVRPQFRLEDYLDSSQATTLAPKLEPRPDPRPEYDSGIVPGGKGSSEVKPKKQPRTKKPQKKKAAEGSESSVPLSDNEDDETDDSDDKDSKKKKVQKKPSLKSKDTRKDKTSTKKEKDKKKKKDTKKSSGKRKRHPEARVSRGPTTCCLVSTFNARAQMMRTRKRTDEFPRSCHIMLSHVTRTPCWRKWLRRT